MGETYNRGEVVEAARRRIRRVLTAALSTLALPGCVIAVLVAQ